MTKLTATKALRVSPNAHGKGKGTLKMYWQYQVTIPPNLVKRLAWKKDMPLTISLVRESIRITRIQTAGIPIPPYRKEHARIMRDLRATE